MPADNNYKFFKNELLQITGTHRRQFLLIKNEQIINYYPNAEAVLKDAYRRFNDNGFLIQ